MNMDMKDSLVQLMDLSDEILLIIFEELDNVEMLNSLMGTNTRLDRVLRHPIFTSHLTLMKSSSNGLSHPLDDIMVDRFCSQILPQIHHNIKWLNLDSLSMERVLLASDYPNLCGLGLYEINYDAALRHFSGDSDELILPLLRRMSNLERLTLYLSLDRYTSFIDGNHLQQDIINQLPRLNKFLFNIYSFINITDLLYQPTNEDIQSTFKNFKDCKISSAVDYFPKEGNSLCHIYSHPYRLKHYHHITNNFPGGLFNYVEDISLFDERPFEHEFFIRLTKAFPLLKKLRVSNEEPQNYKNCQNSNNDNRYSSIIEYPHLTDLSLTFVHEDYVEQFLLDTKACLLNNITLQIGYECLQRVTHNFTNNATRVNCAKLTCLLISQCWRYPKLCDTYFPHVKNVFG
ncbi:unnamed protein product [Adineta steineri]|uniref:F-box domain-containing protein n=2 Tax=Adineta steineri TaxID=433720 RepID=A0A819HVQ0_9BILA|nr:unnamed protein product [Adineta steineri]